MTLIVYSVSSSDQCCYLCSTSASCQAWTFAAPSSCWLKGAISKYYRCSKSSNNLFYIKKTTLLLCVFE